MTMENSKSKIATSKNTENRQRQAWRPKSTQASALRCPHCGGDIEASFVICPHCGRSLTPEKCSFCGAAMKPTAKFCTKCGQPREGIKCPECGTLNSRNFCRKCNAPLTSMAQKAIEAAKKDPAFKIIQAKADELAELHAQIEELRNNQAADTTPPELTDEDKRLLDEYADILASIGATKPQKKEQKRKKEPEKRKQYADTTVSLDEIMKAYKEKAAEMNEALAALTPPPEYTPEQQRDYYSARKVATKVVTYDADMTGYRPSVWCCNFCGCLHNCPSDCTRPELGGTWIYTTPEEYAKQNGTVHVSLNIQ